MTFGSSGESSWRGDTMKRMQEVDGTRESPIATSWYQTGIQNNKPCIPPHCISLSTFQNSEWANQVHQQQAVWQEGGKHPGLHYGSRRRLRARGWWGRWRRRWKGRREWRTVSGEGLIAFVSINLLYQEVIIWVRSEVQRTFTRARAKEEGTQRRRHSSLLAQSSPLADIVGKKYISARSYYEKVHFSSQLLWTNTFQLAAIMNKYISARSYSEKGHFMSDKVFHFFTSVRAKNFVSDNVLKISKMLRGGIPFFHDCQS